MDVETVRAIVEIGLLWLGFYAALRFMQGTRGEGIVKGYTILVVIVFIALYFITQELQLRRLATLLNNLLALSFLTLIVIFQPELRNGLIRLGQNPFMRKLLSNRPAMVEEILSAVDRLSRQKIGALIAIQRDVGLGSYVERAIPIDGEVTRQLIATIFWPGSPLHDGAIVIRDGRLAAAGCLFPLTENPEISSALGTRHRAAIGLTDETDAIVVAISEEDGTISLAEHSEIVRRLTLAQLGEMLEARLQPGAGESDADRPTTETRRLTESQRAEIHRGEPASQPAGGAEVRRPETGDGGPGQPSVASSDAAELADGQLPDVSGASS